VVIKMKMIIANGTQRNPNVLRFEHRAYNSWADLRRARTQLRRLSDVHITDYLDVQGPALQIIQARPEILEK